MSPASPKREFRSVIALMSRANTAQAQLHTIEMLFRGNKPLTTTSDRTEQ